MYLHLFMHTIPVYLFYTFPSETFIHNVANQTYTTTPDHIVAVLMQMTHL